MARIQILELPSEEVGNVSVTPFALILDQFDGDGLIDLIGGSRAAAAFTEFARGCGARACLVSRQPIEVPCLTAEEIATINRPHVGTATVDVVPDLTGFADAIREAVEAIGPQKITVRIGDHDITDLVRTEIAEHTRAKLDALGNGRG